MSNNKRRVFVTLFSRHELSLGQNRLLLGSRAYHWAIWIGPKALPKTGSEPCESFDVTNGARVDPVNRVNLNPDGDWYFRHQTRVDPSRSARFIGMIMIGKVPNTVRIEDVAEEMGGLQLPSRDEPDQHCVWWTKRAVRRLQQRGLAEEFDVDRLEADGLDFADQVLERLRQGASNRRLAIRNYTNRPL